MNSLQHAEIQQLPYMKRQIHFPHQIERVFLLVACIINFGCSTVLFAKDYTLKLYGTQNWGSASWEPSGIPGEGDSISNIDGSASWWLFLDGDRQIDHISRQSIENTIVFVSGSLEANGDSTFMITKEIDIPRGSLSFRSKNVSSILNVTVPRLIVGSEGNAGSIYFGGGKEEYRYLNFNVSEETLVRGTGLSRIYLVEELTDEDTHIDLGHLTFEEDKGEAPWLSFAKGSVLLVKSLRVRESPSEALVTGYGTLRIYGNENDSKQPEGENTFSGLVYDNIRIEKVGTNMQIFSRKTGNTYAGGTLITGGILRIENRVGSGVGCGNVQVQDHGKIAGNGMVKLWKSGGSGGTFIIENGGIMAPGEQNGEFSHFKISGQDRPDNDPRKLLEMRLGARFLFHVDKGNESSTIDFGYYRTGDLTLDASGITVDVEGELAPGLYTLFSFHSDEPRSDYDKGKMPSGLTSGLKMGNGFNGFSAEFHYDDPRYGGVGKITMEIKKGYGL